MKNRPPMKFGEPRQSQAFPVIPLTLALSTSTGEAFHAMAA